MKTQAFHLWLIRFVGLIVPARLRADWRQEWEAELRYREAMLAEWDKLNWQTKLDLWRRSLGAFTDALLLQPQRWEDDMMQDLRYGIRMLRKHKAVTFVAVLSLALGIGANTALFSVVDAVLLKPLPVKAPDKLVLFSWRSGPNRTMGSINGFSRRDEATGQFVGSSFSYLTFQQFRAQTATLAEVFAFEPIEQLNVVAGEQAEIASGQFVSGGYYSGLSVQMRLGCAITDADDNGAAVAVLSHPYWQRRFGGDPAIVGKTIQINNALSTIIGVTPPEFLGTLQVGQSPDVTLALGQYAQFRPGRNDLQQPWYWFLRVMARAKPGVSHEQVRGSLEAVLQQTALEGWNAYPADRKARRQDQGARDMPALVVEPGRQGVNETRQAYTRPLQILWFVVGLVLLIACANVANLLLARAAVRQKEMAVRLATGASRFRLLRQLLTESLLLSFLGGALGVAFGYWAKDFLLQWNPWSGNAAPALDLRLDGRVSGFTFGVSLLTGVLFGLIPAWRATQVDLHSTLKDEARSSSGSARTRLSNALIVAQVAMSVLLLIGAGLFVRTLRNLHNVDVGFNTENLLLFRVDPRLNNYRNEQIAPLYEQMIERLQAVPGVRSATLARHPLLSGSSARVGVYPQGQARRGGENDIAYLQLVRANYFETIELPLLAGRRLTEQDDSRAPKVALVNQAFAQQFFPADNPLGRRFDFEVPQLGANVEIVGVVQDAKYTQLRQDKVPTVYAPYLQQASLSQMNFKVRTAGDPLAVLPAIREAVRQVDSKLPLFDVKTQTRQIEESIARERAFAKLTTFFGLLALLLASIGLYGVMAYAVAGRTREIGIRMALGAEASDVLRMVLRQGLRLVVMGAIVGVMVAYNVTNVVASMLYGVTPNDALTFVGVAALLLIVALLACWLPARRAAKTDPMVALRYE